MENPEDLKAKKVELLVFTKGSAFVYVPELVRDLESVGCQVRDSQFMFLTEDDVAKHYAHVVGKPFYPEIERLFKDHPVFIMKVYGTVENVKSVVGKETNPLSCETFSFRGQHGNDMTDNACHRSSSEEDAVKEIDLFFGNEGIVTMYRQNPEAQLEFYNRMIEYAAKNAAGMLVAGNSVLQETGVSFFLKLKKYYYLDN